MNYAKNGKTLCLAVLIVLLVQSTTQFTAGGPFDWAGNGSVEADPNKEYILAETNGPWMIFVASFGGPNAKQEANQLVLELRQRYKYRAYVFNQEFVHDLKKEGKPVNPYSRNKNFKKKGAFREYAVLVGDFQSGEEVSFQKTLKDIKRAYPEFYKRTAAGVALPPPTGSKPNAPTFLAEGERGPLFMAFGALNPMLPEDNFARKGFVDPFIAKINNRPNSLLNCPGKFTVRVATFSGKVEMSQDKVQSILDGKEQFISGKVSDLELGGIAAARLAAALRAKGYEAYEFHDRFESIVTVGHFTDIGYELPNGRIELKPEIVDIMNRFKAKPLDPKRVQPGFLPYEPVTIVGIECDTQPQIVEVPKVRR